MAFCTKCGQILADGAAFCPSCGSPQHVSQQVYQNNQDQPVQPVQPVYVNYGPQQPVKTDSQSGLKTAVKVFMVLGIIATCWCLIPLCWTIPMTVSVFHSFRDGRPVGVGLKICTLLFVNLIAGILLLCINDN